MKSSVQGQREEELEERVQSEGAPPPQPPTPAE